MIKRIFILCTLLLATAYLILAVTTFNSKPADQVCKGMELTVKDSIDYGFVTDKEVKEILKKGKIYPEGKQLSSINVRQLEELLSSHPFIENAECYLTSGGKVAIDLPSGKNLAGSFYQPKAVFIDPDLLKTLPLRFLHDGLAEAIKYGCIRDAGLFAQIAAVKSDQELLEQADSIIETCCNIKARIVEKDEFDTGERMLLNFGHTIGHAIEKCCGFTTYTHGEGVGIGMVQMTRQTEKLGLTAAGTAEELSRVLKKFALPVTAVFDAQEILQAMALDKKKSGKKINLVIIEKIGVGRLHKIDWQDIPAYIG
jgi:hypothetical protein